MDEHEGEDEDLAVMRRVAEWALLLAVLVLLFGTTGLFVCVLFAGRLPGVTP